MKKPRKTDFEEEYPQAYGSLDRRGKVVADVGADIGPSVYYFLSRGAKKVIAFEKKTALREELEGNCAGDERVEVRGSGWAK